MTAIQATANTYFKLKLKDSSQLNQEEKFPLRRDTILELKELGGLDRNHYEIELEEKIEGCNFEEGYVYAPHWGILESDREEEQSEVAVFDNPAVQRQIERLKKYLPDGKEPDLQTKTKYFSQRDNYRDAHRTCNSSSNAMYLDWLLRVCGQEGLADDKPYIQEVFEDGDTIYHGVQSSAIKEWGFKTKWMTDADLDFVEDLLDAGFPVVANILHRGSRNRPSGGHVILLIARKNGQFIAHDPYGTLMSNYTNTDGAYSKIPREVFKRRWQGGYRILA